MRFFATLGAVACIVSGSISSAAAAPHPPPPVLRGVNCTTAIVFGDPAPQAGRLLFRATVSIACPPGIAFSAAFRSVHACQLSSTAGNLRYELYADPAMQTAVVSCEREPEPLHGTGRQNFVVYGRVDGTTAGSGRFTDSLLATVST